MSKSRLREFRVQFRRLFGVNCTIKDRFLWVLLVKERWEFFDRIHPTFWHELALRYQNTHFIQCETKLNRSLGYPADYQLV